MERAEPRLSISVVVPNYNGKHLLEENIPLLIEALKNSGQEYEIIVSDDASTDDSISFLRLKYPEIILLITDRNKGFSPTINKGIMHAKKDLVFALNSDVKLTPDYFKHQLRYFSAEDTFGVMGRIIGVDKDEIQDAAKYPLRKGFTLKSTSNYLYKDLSERPVFTLFMSGANALMDRKKVQELKGFEEIYSPFYGEDVDLSVRAWRLGWKCYYEHESVCRHPASSTIASFHKKQRIRLISLRNKFFFHNIHLEGWELFIWNLQVVLNLLVRWLTFKSVYYKAFAEFFKRRDELRKSKENLQKLFTLHNIHLSVSDVVNKIKNNIGDKEIRRF